MITELAKPVHYQLPVGDYKLDMNSLLGQEISITWLNEIHCMNCGRKIKKSFAQGYCYPCFISIPETEDCVLRPELCRAHDGIARDMEWASEHCLQEHYVYLALSSEIKVGVTRKSQIPTRWIDQGAYKVIRLAKTPNRYWAGLIEVELKKHLTDKTNWRNMLMNQVLTNISLVEEKKKIATLLPSELIGYVSDNDEVVEPAYPFVSIPKKIVSLDLEKDAVKGKLNGIKGQYLIFEAGIVINIRKYGGYLLAINHP
jgi:hypothetical protein